MAYYHDLITGTSWRELKQLRRYCNFVLIGGWAAWLYTKALKSKDIDIISITINCRPYRSIMTW